MKAGKRRSLYLGVLLLAATALAVDQCFLSGGTPQEAGAYSDARVSPDGSAGTPAGLPPATNSSDSSSILAVPYIPFPTGLKPLDGHGTLRDVFALPPSVLSRIGSPSSGDARGGRGVEGDSAAGLTSEEFSIKHRLQGILVHDRLKIAIVDGAWMHVGDAMEGCHLRTLSDHEARFECRDGEAILKVAYGERPAPR